MPRPLAATRLCALRRSMPHINGCSNRPQSTASRSRCRASLLSILEVAPRINIQSETFGADHYDQAENKRSFLKIIRIAPAADGGRRWLRTDSYSYAFGSGSHYASGGNKGGDCHPQKQRDRQGAPGQDRQGGAVYILLTGAGQL